jgi:hypothetical protein
VIVIYFRTVDESLSTTKAIMLITMLIVLIIVGVALYLLNTLVPMDSRIKTVINVVVIIVVLLYVLQAFGILPAHLFPSLK